MQGKTPNHDFVVDEARDSSARDPQAHELYDFDDGSGDFHLSLDKVHDSDVEKRVGEEGTKTRKDEESSSDTEYICCDIETCKNTAKEMSVYKCYWDPKEKSSRLRSWFSNRYPKYSKITQFEPNEGCGGMFCQEHISTLPEHTDQRDELDENKYHLCLGCSEKEHTV